VNVKSAWNTVRKKESVVVWGNKIWDKQIPPKVSMFLWSLCHNILPTKIKAQTRNYKLALKCCCYRTMIGMDS
jgi:hypothetical protein